MSPWDVAAGCFGAAGLISAGTVAYMYGRGWLGRPARKERRTRALQARARAANPAPPVDALADLLETKAAIRKDELRRWAEAWQRAAGLPDFWAAARQISEIEYVAVRQDRERRLAGEAGARRLAIEQRQAERAEKLAAEQREREQQLVAVAAHETHLAERRRRYAEARRRNA